MSGEGADEFFGGYNIYHEPISLKGYQKIPKCVRKGLAAVAKKMPDIKGRDFIIRGSKTVEEDVYKRQSQVFLEEGETQTVETLIKCIIIASGNDASVEMCIRDRR